MKNAITKEQILEIAYSNRDGAHAALVKFHSKFLEDPFYSFQWADSEMKCAAQLSVAKEAIRILAPDSNATAHDVIKHYENEIFRKARNVASQSTGNASTFMARAYIEAMADFLNAIDWR